ncbi:MAG TPA: hypothetical protein ENK46_14055 [Flavobacteriia bacterium]|nr:hypothetical protein [Flavobacteriia bacterium]
MKNHWLKMIIGCGLPLLFIFLAPLFGIESNLSISIFISVMFACHLLMLHRLHNHRNDKHSQHQENKNKI